MARRFYGVGGFLPRFYPERLEEPYRLRKPARIGVGFMGDMFGWWNDEVEEESRIIDILEVVSKCPQHIFVFLTKNPRGLLPYKFPPNAWVGVSACNQEMLDQAAPIMDDVKAKVKWLSLEPLLGEINSLPPPWLPNWVVIGGQTGPGAVKPLSAWIEGVVGLYRLFAVPYWEKNNLASVLGRPLHQDIPLDIPKGEANLS